MDIACIFITWVGAKDIIVAVSAFGGLIVAILGLNTWRRQLKGKTEYDLARRFLRSAYAVRDAISICRSPFMSAEEMAWAKYEVVQKYSKPGEAQPEIDAVTVAYNKRWENVQGKYSDFALELLEAEVLGGKSIVDLASGLDKCVRELRANLLLYSQNRSPNSRIPVTPELMTKIEAIVFPIQDSNGVDQYGEKVNQAIKNIEDFVRPRLKE